MDMASAAMETKGKTKPKSKAVPRIHRQRDLAANFPSLNGASKVQVTDLDATLAALEESKMKIMAKSAPMVKSAPMAKLAPMPKSAPMAIVAPSVPRDGTRIEPRSSSPLLFETDHERRERPLEVAFYPGSDKVLFHIGGYKYLVINQATGITPSYRIRIAELSTDPSRKTILVRLNLQQWVDLCSWSGIINDTIERERNRLGSGITEENGQKRMHLGSNVYVSLKKGLGGVDFRWFWLPPKADVDYQQDPTSFDVQPSRYGIWLSYKEWFKLDSLRELVLKCIPALEGMDDCPSTHFNQEGSFLCKHCNPNGYHAWL
jgi:hypothetical protein